MIRLPGVFSCALAALPLAGQAMAVTLGDGSETTGEVLALRDGQLELRGEGRTTTIPWRRVLGLHGPAPRAGATATVHLVGGDQVRGELRAGDAAGETLVVESRSLGAVSVPLDRVRALFLHALAGARTEFSDAERGSHAEVLFVPARRGLDAVGGAIHRFTSEGVLFAPGAAAEPRLFPYARLAGLALRDGQPAEPGAEALLLTRSGDAVSVRVHGATAQAIEVEGERGRRSTLPWSEVSALLRLGAGHVFASALEPDSADESSFFGDGVPLHPWRRDRCASGGFLVVGGRTFPRGLGVHSRSALTFRVPAGAARFCAQVGIDDDVLSLPARGEVDVSVLLDGREVFVRRGVRSGGGRVNLGCVPVRPGAQLTLQVAHGAGLDLGDRVDWLHAVFLPEGDG